MPIYEYECPECGETKKLKRRISERDEPVECDYCIASGFGAEKQYYTMDRIPSNFGVKWNTTGGYRGGSND